MSTRRPRSVNFRWRPAPCRLPPRGVIFNSLYSTHSIITIWAWRSEVGHHRQRLWNGMTARAPNHFLRWDFFEYIDRAQRGITWIFYRFPNSETKEWSVLTIIIVIRDLHRWTFGHLAMDRPRIAFIAWTAPIWHLCHSEKRYESGIKVVCFSAKVVQLRPKMV